MEIYDLFYKWVPVYVRLPVLFILLLVILTANGVFLGNITDMYNSFGEYAEPYTQASNALYIGMGLGLMVESRLKQRFSSKSLLLYGLSMMFIFNAICATTEDTSVMIAACFLLGFTKITALVEVYIVWTFIWSKQGNRARFYPFVYGTALAGLYFVTWLTTSMAYHFNWRYAYIIVLISISGCLMLTMIFVESHPLKKRIPLYQVDWIGLALLASVMMLFDYAVVYAKVEDWLESKKIILFLFATVIALLFFIKRQLSIKRPLFDLRLFQVSSFRIGLCYFFLLGIFVPSTFQSVFITGVLHFESIRNAEVNLYLIPGVAVGSVVCYFWYLKNLDPEPLIFIGFLSFVLYHIIMYNSFATDFKMEDFLLPSILKGFAMAVLYIAIGLYTTNKLALVSVVSAAGMMILIRSFVGSGTFAAFYNYMLYAQRNRHFAKLSSMTEAGDFLTRQQGTTAEFYKNLQLQSILTASKEISAYIIISGLLLLAVILGTYLYQKIKGQYSAAS